MNEPSTSSHTRIAHNDPHSDNTADVADTLWEKLPLQTKGALTYSAKNTIVLDDLDIPIFFRRIAGMGSKFQFPQTVDKSADLLGLTTIVITIIDAIYNGDVRKRILGKLNEALIRHHGNDGTQVSLTDAYLNAELRRCINYYRDQSDFIAMDSDKGGKTIISRKSTIINKTAQFIEKQIASGSYIRIGNPNATAIVAQNTRASLFKSKKHRYNELRSLNNPTFMQDRYGGHQGPKDGFIYEESYTMARMNMQMKAHKGDTFPVRPIIAAPGAMGHEVEEFLLHRLKKMYMKFNITGRPYLTGIRRRLEENRHIVTNSMAVKSELDELTIPSNHRMVLIDFADMYTNLDVGLAVHKIHHKYNDIIANSTTMSAEAFTTLLRSILAINSNFSSDHQIYRQRKGVPMGGLLSYAISEIVTGDGIKNAMIEALTKGIEISYVAKYVDDILVIMDMGDSLANLSRLTALIAEHLPNMPLTTDLESTTDDGLPHIKYLQMRLHRIPIERTSQQRIATRWSRQAYASGRMISAISAHDWGTKANVGKEAIRSAATLSSEMFRTDAICEVCSGLYSYGFNQHSISNWAKGVCSDENISWTSIQTLVDAAISTAQTSLLGLVSTAATAAADITNTAQPNRQQLQQPMKDPTEAPLCRAPPASTALERKIRSRTLCSLCGTKRRTWTKEINHTYTCDDCQQPPTVALQHPTVELQHSIATPIPPTPPAQGTIDNLNPITTTVVPSLNPRKKCFRFGKRKKWAYSREEAETMIKRSRVETAAPIEEEPDIQIEEEPGIQQEEQQQENAPTILQADHPNNMLADHSNNMLADHSNNTLDDRDHSVRPDCICNCGISHYVARETPRNAACQTDPTKGRPRQDPEIDRMGPAIGPINPGIPLYIKGPFVHGLSEEVHKIFKEERIATTIATKGRTNPLFGNTKDIIPLGERTRSIFHARCILCGLNIYDVAWYRSVAEQAQLLDHLAQKAGHGHHLDMQSITFERSLHYRKQGEIMLTLYALAMADQICNTTSRKPTQGLIHKTNGLDEEGLSKIRTNILDNPGKR